ncbi:carboxypeptidase-like regulatory domain-containing protein [Algoriphagus pacificus]|uniref:Carboxypeptidase-like regulatory domain-containing protein n=1 Tax=Algoriphagus pacificus TaxID=2811234 RepID=A0ABS3CLR4_9BACT|nr:carboxypeptidase-like regulatory domain-containing protein [Algoriphagus pacificus]MBN7818037.1 carboxypeptidase-like regulatory domain-containing protein [Algoriphagus pacificus]
MDGLVRKAFKGEGRIDKNATLPSKRILFSLILIFLCGIHCQTIFGQSISGSVMDFESKEPLVNSYIFIKNYPEFNWITNDEGAFSIKFPESIKNDTLVVSFLGYKSKVVPLLSLNTSGVKIELDRLMIALDEIVVRPETFQIENLINDILENLERNYPSQSHQLSGFYRKISTDYNEFTGLVEGAVTIQDVGYSKSISKSRIELNSLRKGDDLAEVDSVFLDYLDKLEAGIVKETGVKPISNDLISLYRQNPARGAYLEDALFTEKGLRMALIGIPEIPVYHEIVGYEVVEKDTVFQIVFGSTDPPIGTSFIKVNSRDFAVVELQQKVFLNADRTDYDEIFVKYGKVKEKYYPEKIVYKKMRLINRNVGGHSMDIHTYWFDEVNTGKFKKIRKKDVEKADEIIGSKVKEYNQDIWINSEFLKKHPLDSAIIRSLERFRSLEEQFKSNGKK